MLQEITFNQLMDNVFIDNITDTKLQYTTDPSGWWKEKHPNDQPDYVAYAGLLLPWAYEAADLRGDPDTWVKLVDHMDHRYGFGLTDFEGKVGERCEYISKYEEDAPLYPLLHIEMAGAEMFIYEYGICAMREVGVERGDWFITRMD
tara:strand:- start:544 stop:984 length:441 start_codon:yes stop_codon:yes gene_type:complete